MPVEFDRHNREWEADNPGEPNYADTGADTATSIQRLANGENATHDVLRRPDEQLRRRTRHMQEEHNLLAEFMTAIQGRFLDMRAARCKWHGLAAANTANRGVFETNGTIYVKHPMYPDTTYEIPSSVFGNSSTGFFQYEYNRLKEEGDSLWIVWGDELDSSSVRDGNARTTYGVSSTVTQLQLRKGPTWVLIQETGIDLSAQGIVVGSDKIRIYNDPIGAPASYLERVIKEIHQDDDGNWYVEVPHDTPLYDSTKAIPPTASPTHLLRTSSGDEYEIVDDTGAVVRVPQRSFANYCSNLWWFKAGRKHPMQPYDASATPTPKYRENEWQYALPLCVVSNGDLFWPLAATGGLAPNIDSFQSLSGLMRTGQADTVLASHVFEAVQNFKRAAGSDLISLTTDSNPVTPGAATHVALLNEAHTDGTSSSPVYWNSPSRPGSFGLRGKTDPALPFIQAVEQGYYEAGGAYVAPENAIRLREMGSSFIPTSHASTYAELRASQFQYVPSVNNLKKYSRSTADLINAAWFTSVTGYGHPIGTYIELGQQGKYDTVKGKHSVAVKGYVGFRDIYSWLLDYDTSAQGENNPFSSQGLDFEAHLLLTPDASPTNPMAIAVDYKTPKSLVWNNIQNAITDSGASFTVDYFTPNQVHERVTLKTIQADVAPGTNDLYPAIPTPGSTTIFEALFLADMARIQSTASDIITRHSEVALKVVAVPTYDAGSQQHRIQFFAQFEFRTEEADASQTDRQNNSMYCKTFKSLTWTPTSDPTFVADLAVVHQKVWAA